MAKKKRITKKGKTGNGCHKKCLQAEGIIPPDKPRLNRKQFIGEAQAEWEQRDYKCCVWDLYLAEAVFCMLAHRDARNGRTSLEAVGAAKVLKLAIRLQKLGTELAKKGRRKCSGDEWYSYIKDIMDA